MKPYVIAVTGIPGLPSQGTNARGRIENKDSKEPEHQHTEAVMKQAGVSPPPPTNPKMP